MALAKQSQSVYSRYMKNAKHIRTYDDLFAAFRAVCSVGIGRHGKPLDAKRAMADWFGISYQYVCNWFAKLPGGEEPKGIPGGYQYRTHLWALHHGYVIHPSLFGYRADGKPLSRAESAAA